MLREQKHTAKARNKQSGQPYWTESVSEQQKRRAGSVRKTGAMRAHQHRMPPCCNVPGSLV